MVFWDTIQTFCDDNTYFRFAYFAMYIAYFAIHVYFYYTFLYYIYTFH